MPTALDNAVERTTQRRGPVQCKPLLDAATKDLFRKNAFRITGLSVEATPREVAKHADKLKLMEELGQSAAIHSGAVALHPPPTLDQIREATQRLKDPEKRLIDEFFWFWPWETGRTTPDPALEVLASGNADDALKIWAARETNPSGGVVATHNIALFWQLRALDLETDNTGPEADRAQEQMVEKYWRNSLKRWKYLTFDDLLWDKVAARVRQLDDPRLAGFVRNMRATLPNALAKVNAELALSHAEKGRTHMAQMHVQFLRDGSDGSSSLERVLHLALAPACARLREHIRHAKQAAEQDPGTADRAARDSLAQAVPLIAIFNLFFGDAEHPAKELLDDAATASVDCLVSYQKKTGDNRTFVELLQRTLPLCQTPDAQQRVEENIRIGQDNLALADLEPIHTFCEGAARAAEAHPACADKQAHRILSAATKLLSSLSGSGLPRNTIDQATDEIALAVMHCAVLFGNKTENWKACITILERSLRLAVTSDVKTRVIKNLETVRNNITLHSDLTPISSAPSLSTINGIGFSLYGCTDHDPTTGSYLATYCFVVLWIPIFPLCRYRVARTSNAYRFFGQAPLRTFDKWHLAISIIGLITALIIGLISSSSAPTGSPSPSPSTTYTPSPTPSTRTGFSALPDFGDGAAATPQPLPAPTTKRTYRIPSSVSAELETAKQQISIEKAKSDALDTRLVTAKQGVEAQQSQLDDLRSRQETLGRQIDRDRIYLDPTNQSEIDDFNAKVNRYNTLLRNVRAENATANELIDSYNTLLEEAKAQDRGVSQMIDSYNAKLRLYGR